MLVSSYLYTMPQMSIDSMKESRTGRLAAALAAMAVVIVALAMLGILQGGEHAFLPPNSPL